jgi:hypothetical protein
MRGVYDTSARPAIACACVWLLLYVFVHVYATLSLSRSLALFLSLSRFTDPLKLVGVRDRGGQAQLSCVHERLADGQMREKHVGLHHIGGQATIVRVQRPACPSHPYAQRQIGRECVWVYVCACMCVCV